MIQQKVEPDPIWQLAIPQQRLPNDIITVKQTVAQGGALIRYLPNKTRNSYIPSQATTVHMWCSTPHKFNPSGSPKCTQTIVYTSVTHVDLLITCSRGHQVPNDVGELLYHKRDNEHLKYTSAHATPTPTKNVHVCTQTYYHTHKTLLYLYKCTRPYKSWTRNACTHAYTSHIAFIYLSSLKFTGC